MYNLYDVFALRFEKSKMETEEVFVVLSSLSTAVSTDSFFELARKFKLPEKERFSMISLNLLVQNFQSRSTSLIEWLHITACNSNNKLGFQWSLGKFR